jgi:DNA-binding transcriptional MerR regulator
MTPLSTEDFPYTAGYVMELLALDERQLSSLVRLLSLSPRQDEETGRTIFTHRDIEQLKKASEMSRQGEEPEVIARRLGVSSVGSSTIKIPSSPVSRPEQTVRSEVLASAAPGAVSSATLPSTTVSLPSKTAMLAGQDNIAAMVEAVSQVKEGILKDLSRLLDDKLAGLDEVVVELIRCKSENDSLKKKLNEAVLARESLEQELSRFKPVQFGFYRKV